MSTSLIAAALLPYGFSVGDRSLIRGDDTVVDGTFPTVPFIFNGEAYSQVFVSTNGFISLGEQWNVPGSFPFPSPPIIAPFSIDLTTAPGGNVFYRFTSDRTILQVFDEFVDEIGGGVQRHAVEALIVTWYNVSLSSINTITTTFQAALVTNGLQSYIFFVYDDSYHPDGAEVGINYGNGQNYISEVTNSNSAGIENRGNVPTITGLFYYRADIMQGSNVTSPSDICYVNLDLRPGGYTTNSFRVLDGTPQTVITIQYVEVCSNGRFGGICDRYLDSLDAAVICRYFGFIDIIGKLKKHFTMIIDCIFLAQ